MCFSPQRRAILRHRNFKKCFGPDVFCTFSLENVLFATAACNFWCHLSARTSAPAALTGLLLDWPDTRIYEKTQHFVTSLTFGADESSFFELSDYCFFCRLTWLLYYCFSTLHIVGSFYLNFLRLYIYILDASVLFEWFLFALRLETWAGGYGSTTIYCWHLDSVYIGWVTDWLTDSLTDWLIDWLTDWLSDWLIDWLTD